VQKEIFPKDSVSLGAISDNASTRAMAGSIISSYNPQDRCVVWASWKCLRCSGWWGLQAAPWRLLAALVL